MTLQLLKVRKNAGSKLSPSFVRPNQILERGKELNDDQALKLCQERDALNTELYSRSSANQRQGRWTVVDEIMQEVEL